MRSEWTSLTRTLRRVRAARLSGIAWLAGDVPALADHLPADLAGTNHQVKRSGGFIEQVNMSVVQTEAFFDQINNLVEQAGGIQNGGDRNTHLSDCG